MIEGKRRERNRIGVYANAYSTHPKGVVSIGQWIRDAIRGKSRSKHTEMLLQWVSTLPRGSEEFRKAKRALPCVTYAGVFAKVEILKLDGVEVEGLFGCRTNDGLVNPSGLVFVESDDVGETGNGA